MMIKNKRLAITLTAAALLSTGLSTTALAQATRTATLNWIAPTERENGTALAVTDLAEFRIYNVTPTGPVSLGKAPGTATTLTLPLAAKTCYRYVVTAVDKEGNESAHSNEAQLCTFGPRPPKTLAAELVK